MQICWRKNLSQHAVQLQSLCDPLNYIQVEMLRRIRALPDQEGRKRNRYEGDQHYDQQDRSRLEKYRLELCLDYFVVGGDQKNLTQET